MLIVKKFGGSSVANKERIFNVAKRCIEDYRAGHDVVVVLSAMGDTTDDLIALANTINPNAKKRELDMLLTTGEQVSVSLMAMAMQALDVSAVSLNAFQVMMHSTSRYGNARFKRVDTERIMHELDSRKIVIVTGFQGVNKYDDITTLGRGGSDTTAVALAAVLHADKCEIYTDVDGVFTADPRVVKTAKKLDAVTYDEMLELASLGAKVLHNRSVEMAKKYNVELVVRSSLNRSEGTVVKEGANMEKLLVTGVAADKDTVRISVIGLEDKPGTAFAVFNTLAANNINVDIDAQTGALTLEASVMFDYDQAELTDAGKQALEQILPIYCKVLLQDDYMKYLAEIIIDGYTDTDGDYAYNLELSQRRSLAVAQYLLDIQGEFLTADQSLDLQDYLTVNGHSMANPILDANGNVDKEASRRVEVKFRLKDDEMIDELSKIMSGSEDTAGSTDGAADAGTDSGN